MVPAPYIRNIEMKREREGTTPLLKQIQPDYTRYIGAREEMHVKNINARKKAREINEQEKKAL